MRGGVFGFSYFPIPSHLSPLPIMGGVGHTIDSCIMIIWGGGVGVEADHFVGEAPPPHWIEL